MFGPRHQKSEPPPDQPARTTAAPSVFNEACGNCAHWTFVGVVTGPLHRVGDCGLHHFRSTHDVSCSDHQPRPAVAP